MPADHLDDDAINALIDSEPDDATAVAHLSACATCQARKASLTSAAQLVATPVEPLPAATVDAMVEAALNAGRVSTIPSLADARKRRWRPRALPPTWTIGIAAALIGVLGISALLRATGDRNQVGSLVTKANVERSSGGAASGVDTAASDASLGSDLGDLDSADTAVARLRARLGDDTAAGFATERSADQVEPAPMVAQPTAKAAGSTAGGGTAGNATAVSTTAATPPPQPPPPPCATQARRAGGDHVTDLVYVSSATWKGKPAEVFVYRLAAATPDGATRQAFVMVVASCDLVADPRF